MISDNPTDFLSRKIGDYEIRILKLEREMICLKNIIKEYDIKKRYGKLNDRHIFVLNNMKMNKKMPIKEIQFPEGVNCLRGKRNYMMRLEYYGFIESISDNRWKQYRKIKDIDVV